MDRDRLIDALFERGVTYLAGGRGLPSEMSDAELIIALTQSDDARVRLALIPLFLSDPGLAALVPSIIKQLEPEFTLNLKQRYTAAACLQRLWRTRLSEVVTDGALLPDLFSDELGLPSFDELYGKLALFRLAEQMSDQHQGIDFWTSFNKTFDDFIHQLELERRAA